MGTSGTTNSPLVPVLCYHAITETPGDHIAPFTVSPAAFERQLDLLVTEGYRCVTFGEMLRREAAGTLDGRTAVVTFDDGYADFATAALPALKARSIPSTLFVTTGWLEDAAPREPGPTDTMLSFRQLPELLAEGVELGAHSHGHPEMDTLRTAALREELSRPRKLLEDTLGQAVTTFAYPHGYHGPRVRRLTREAGYDSAAGVRNAVHRPGEDRFAISRLMLLRTTTLDGLAAWLRGRAGVARTDREAWQTTGWRAYRRGRAVLRRAPGHAYR